MNSSTTLRQLNGLDPTPATLDGATLILVDYQNTYTRGVMELAGWQPALASASELLTRARAAGTNIIHVVHDGGEGSPYDLAAEIGQIHPAVAPLPNEPVVVKTAPNAFVGTDLGERVEAAGNKQVIVMGFISHVRDVHRRGCVSTRQPAHRGGRCMRDAAHPNGRGECVGRGAA